MNYQIFSLFKVHVLAFLDRTHRIHGLDRIGTSPDPEHVAANMAAAVYRMMQNLNKEVRKLGCEPPEPQERHRSPVVKTNDDHSFTDMSHDNRNSHPICK
jgi:hypothetical protein